MDQTTPKPPLSQQVEECLNANLTILEGSKYVNMYHTGYTLVTRLIRIRQQHPDPQIRAKAKEFLDEIDLNEGLGITYRAVYRFSMINPIKAKVHRQKSYKGMKRLTPFEQNRIAEFSMRSDLSEDEHSEIKRIQASIVEDKIASVDYAKLKEISAKYHPVIHNANGKKAGWSKMEEKTYNDVQALLNRQDVSDPDKKRVRKLMGDIQDDRIRTIDLFEIGKIIADNRFSKKELAKRQIASKTFENAVSMACQACENLDDMRIPVLPKDNRVELVAKISLAALNLLRLQHQLIHEEEENDDGRYQGSIRSGEESLSNLAPVAATIYGESRYEDSE